MIWGATLEPGREHTETVGEEVQLTMASIDSRLTQDGKCDICSQVLMKTDRAEYVLCTLVNGSVYQQSLDLRLMPQEKVTFSVQGKCVVYLTGYSMSYPEDFETELMDSENYPQDNWDNEEQTGKPVLNTSLGKPVLNTSDEVTKEERNDQITQEDKGTETQQEDNQSDGRASVEEVLPDPPVTYDIPDDDDVPTKEGEELYHVSIGTGPNDPMGQSMTSTGMAPMYPTPTAISTSEDQEHIPTQFVIADAVEQNCVTEPTPQMPSISNPQSLVSQQSQTCPNLQVLQRVHNVQTSPLQNRNMAVYNPRQPRTMIRHQYQRNPNLRGGQLASSNPQRQMFLQHRAYSQGLMQQSRVQQNLTHSLGGRQMITNVRSLAGTSAAGHTERVGNKNVHRCYNCGNLFKSISIFLSHQCTPSVQNIHGTINCKFCGKRFNRLWNCQRHEDTHIQSTFKPT